MAHMDYVILDGVTWNVIEVNLDDLHAGARFTLTVDYDRTVTETVYEVTSAAGDNTHGWVFVHSLEETGDPLRVADRCLASGGFFPTTGTAGGRPLRALHFVDPEFYTESIVHGAQLALALRALDNGVDIHDDGSVYEWKPELEQAVDVPDYGVAALDYAETHGLAININPGSSDAALTDAGEALLAQFRTGYANALQAGWTDVPAQ